MAESRREGAFLLMTTRVDAYRLAGEIGGAGQVVWSSPAYGPYSVLAYAEAPARADLARFVERVRTRSDVAELDARMCKYIPGDEKLVLPRVWQPEVAMLLINVNYKEEKERIVTYNLRDNPRVQLARAMWGPADVIALVDAQDHEAMRNLICDEIKVMKGVASNTTLYCYPEA